MVKFSTGLVLIGLLCSSFLAAAEKPRELDKDDREAVLLKVIAIYSVDRNFTAAQKQLETLQQRLVSAVNEHRELIAEMTAKYEAPENCTLNDQSEWVCTDAAAAPAEEPPSPPASNEQGK